MNKYRVKGTIRIEYTWDVDEEVEAENEDDAIDAVCEDLETYDAYYTEFDTYAAKVEKIEPPAEPSEAERMIALGMPMLPGFA